MKYRQPRSGKGGGHPDRDQKRGEPRRGQTPPFTINAPYNFVPLSETVVTPDWANLVSHDVPFKDGLCGELHFTIETKSPLLVGGKRRKATSHQEGEVWFHKNTSGQFEIPGSSLEGMVRNVFEIATFSRMKLVDDKRFGLRDISSRSVSASYADKIKSKDARGHEQSVVGCAYLQRDSTTGRPMLYKCEHVRVHHDELAEYLEIEPNKLFKYQDEATHQWEDIQSTRDKYVFWEQKLDEKNRSASYVWFSRTVDSQQRAGLKLNSEQSKGNSSGQIVLTGYIQNKRKEFIFFNKSKDPIDILKEDPSAWSDFLFIHADDEDNRSNRPWPGYWKNKYHHGSKVPLFFMESSAPKKMRLALAYLPKLAADFSVLEMIGHTSTDHVQGSKGPDMTDLLFGFAADESGGGLKARVHFGTGVLDGDAQVFRTTCTVLAEPKPSFYPNYVVQSKTRVTNGEQYNTYMSTSEALSGHIRGWKRYPVRDETEITLTRPPTNNRLTQVRLNRIENARFSASVRFHNLRPEELGAFIWALRFSHSGKCRHSLGMGKPLGYGQVQVSIDEEGSKLIPNDPGGKADSLDHYVGCFKKYMDKMVAAGNNGGWEATEQIDVLTAMADINERKRFNGELKYMPLTDYRKAKRDGAVLGSYKADNKKR